MPTQNAIPIIVLQRCVYAYEVIQDLLLDEKLAPNQDFFLTNKPSDVERKIISGVPQLLITGSVTGDRKFSGRETARFVESLRVKNPYLTVISYSGFNMEGGPYDSVILRRGLRGAVPLIERMRSYRSS